MSDNNILSSFIIFILSGMVLLATSATGLSNTSLKVFAADNCDPTSTCTNSGSGSTQVNNCRESVCSNSGDESTQNNNCVGIGTVGFGGGCSNDGRESTQANQCTSTGRGTCYNIGDGSKQTNNCVFGFCSNIGDKNSIQNNNCRAKENPLGGPNTVCENRGDGSTQNVNCIDVSVLCQNQGHGSTMNLNCVDVGKSCSQSGDGKMNLNCARMEVGCSNANNPGNPSEMNVICADGGACRNLWLGKGSVTQTIICHKSVCANEARSSGTTQTTICNNAGGFDPEGCGNTGRDTTVLANGAPCNSGAPRTTTICQPGRTFTILK
jgi:hypothetical protein